MVGTKLHPLHIILCPLYKFEVARTIYIYVYPDFYYLHLIVSSLLANYALEFIMQS